MTIALRTVLPLAHPPSAYKLHLACWNGEDQPLDDSTGQRPFERVGTAAYSCHNADDATVGQALADFGHVLNEYSRVIGFASISLLRRAGPARQWSDLR